MRAWKYKNIILTILIILTLAFIWGNSLMPRDESTEMSTWALRHFNEVLGRISGKPLTVSEHFLRKLAHFTEFAVLGMEMLARAIPISVFWDSLPEAQPRKAPLDRKACIVTAVCGLAAAMIDESLQGFSDRSPQISDVFLDFAGFLAGAAIIYVILALIAGNIGRNRLHKIDRTKIISQESPDD